MKRILSSFNLSGLFRKRQKLDDNRAAEKDADAAGTVLATTPERVPRCEVNEAGATAELARGLFSRQLRKRKAVDLDDEADNDSRDVETVQTATISSASPLAERHTTFPVVIRKQRKLTHRVSVLTRKQKRAIRDDPSQLPRSPGVAGRFVLPRDILHKVEVLNGYYFNDVSLLEEALYLGPKPTVIGGRAVMESNLRLASVGDRALALVWWDHWYDRHESRGEGDKRFQLASANRELAAVGWHHCLDDFVTDEEGFIGRKLSVKRMADTVEAFIGAVFLDSERDLEAVKHVMIALMGRKRVDSV